MIKKKRKVVIVEKMFASYRKPIFDLLAEKVEFRVFHGKNNSGIKAAETVYSKQVPSIQYHRNESALLLFPLFQILKFRPQIVLMDFALGMLNLPVIILICKAFGIKCAFWSHGYNRSIGFNPENRFSDKYRLLMLKMVDANIVYGQEDKAVLGEYLTKSEIFVAQNTLDTNAALRIRQKLELQGREKIKEQLKIRHETNLIFIGRMISAKRPELLIEMYKQLRDKHNMKVGVHFIGDGPMLEPIKSKVKKAAFLDDFYFHGASYDEVKNGELLFISDLMVMPAFVGLSVNHALCFNCPVMTFKKLNGYPTHGPEVEYVVHNKTGFLLEDHSADAMATAAFNLFSSEDLKFEFQNNMKSMVTDVFPMEKMVEGAMDCIDHLTNK